MNENNGNDSGRNSGKSAQRMNIAAGIIVADTVRTTLGPKGMDKMLVDQMGNIIITNDGVTILREMLINHPAAKMLVEVSMTQDQEVGDGTTTAVILAGELLKQAEGLIDKNIHPTIIANGYRMASIKALEALNNISEKMAINSETLEKIAITAMTGKSAEFNAELLAKIISEAISKISLFHQKRNEEETCTIDREALKIEKRTGGSVEDSELIQGIIIANERVNVAMPTGLMDAKILLIDTALEMKEAGNEAQIRITSPEQMQAFQDQEEKILNRISRKIIDSGATVVLCEKGIDESIQYALTEAKIFAARRVKKDDLEKLAKATGAIIVNDTEAITDKVLGFAGLVEQKKIGGQEMTFIEQCKNPKSVTILLRGATEHVIDEIERAVIDAIGDIISVMQNNGRIVAGGGSSEMEIQKELMKYSNTLSSREQLAIRAYATAMEVIPVTLAENAGIDSLDVITSLKKVHEADGGTNYGINVFTGQVTDMKALNVIEPLKLITQAITGATEAAIMILRIDDIIARTPDNKQPQEMAL
jgi:thermosome